MGRRKISKQEPLCPKPYLRLALSQDTLAKKETVLHAKYLSPAEPQGLASAKFRQNRL